MQERVGDRLSLYVWSRLFPGGDDGEQIVDPEAVGSIPANGSSLLENQNVPLNLPFPSALWTKIGLPREGDSAGMGTCILSGMSTFMITNRHSR